MMPGRSTWPARLAFLPPVLAGIFLRLQALPRQILLDDEWHSLNFVLDKSFWSVLTTHGMGANCIPQNILNWIFLHTTGWSELILYLPSVCCGVAGLLLFPALVSRLAGRSTALGFAWLFAISPLLIFYSRIVRPYSMVLFFGFYALLRLALWVRTGARRELRHYGASGVLAIYFHAYAALPVLAPLAMLGLAAGTPRLAPAPWIRRRTLVLCGLGMIAPLVLLLGPAHLQNPWWQQALGVSRATLSGLREFLLLLAGTRFLGVALAGAALALLGLRTGWRREPAVSLIWTAVLAAFGAFLALGNQEGMHAAIQIARYNIILFPVAMLLVAGGWETVAARFRSAPARRLAEAALLAALLAGSPLGRTGRPPNNFMHHSAFQDSYTPIDWSQSRLRQLTQYPLMPRERIPDFYARLAADPAVPGLIEYPMFVGDPLNLHYYTQHVHRKPVAIGVVPDFPYPELLSRNAYVPQTTGLDYIFSRARGLGLEARMRFANLLPLTDPARLRRTHAGWLVVVHRHILRETLRADAVERDPGLQPPAALPMMLMLSFGSPVFEDEHLIVWRIP